MDRQRNGDCGAALDPGPLLPSRRTALDTLRRALSGGSGPVLLTGEAGSGKTWIACRLASEPSGPGAPNWVALDLPPALDPAGLLRMVAESLGLPTDPLSPADSIRRRLAAHLAELAADGHHRALLVDEAHLATNEVLEELRVLSNRLGRPDGFRALLLVGQTPLLHRLAARPLEALAVRLAAQVHLGPVEVEEVSLLVSAPNASLAQLERWHRDAGGNPGRLARLDRPRAAASGPRRAEPAPSARVDEPRPHAPALVPVKPPLRVEDGLIEVGWEGDADPRPEPSRAAAPAPAAPAATLPLGVEEVVDDPYAAIQAWSEWSASQGRGPIDPHVDDNDDLSDSAVRQHPNRRAETAQTFAPYSQLFSRLEQARHED